MFQTSIRLVATAGIFLLSIVHGYQGPSHCSWSRLAICSPRGQHVSRRARATDKAEQESVSTAITEAKIPAATVIASATIPTTGGTSTTTFRSSQSDIPLQQQSPRGKVNEIDFCIAPADASLSRAYWTEPNGASETMVEQQQQQQPVLSLTRALNNASNRAVRRILLARSWPSAEALNLSLRQVAVAAAASASVSMTATTTAITPSFTGTPSPAVPTTEPTGGAEVTTDNAPKCPVPRPILNVLTRRRKKTAPTETPNTNDIKEEKEVVEPPKPRTRTDEEYVADQIKNFADRYGNLPGYSFAQEYLQAILSLATSGLESETAKNVLENGVYDEAYKRILSVLGNAGAVFEVDPKTNRRRIGPKLMDQDICLSVIDKLNLQGQSNEEDDQQDSASATTQETDRSIGVNGITNEDLGGVLLSAKEPSMTRQLNSLANIVQRALLFGGDEELLVLAETLDADCNAFIERWYPASGDPVDPKEQETRAGVQFLNSMIALLRACYNNGVISDVNPQVTLTQSYANAYERLVASAIELGSGYLKPAPSNILALRKPRTAQEELGRFAVWETTFRQSNLQKPSAYPNDLIGSWEVKDLIGGETIGVSKVVLRDNGVVEVKDPLEGLRWRLDPGPTHLDTCTFQVLGSDGTILQYRGFIDRGARLEARFSRRSIKIRGSVMFQMRDGSIDYYKDILPINYRTGTTKFVMTKLSDNPL